MRLSLQDFISVWLLLTCLGCSEFETNVERGARMQELYYGLGTEPATIDPHLATGLTEFNVMMALFEGLINIDAATGKLGARRCLILETIRGWTAVHFLSEPRCSLV